MRSPVFRFVLVLGALAAGSAAVAAAKTTQPPPTLTLYEKADFTGRHITFRRAADTARQAFDAHSAKSVGVWTLCEGRDPTSKCQTVNGSAPKLKVQPAIARPGVDAVALYEEPGLKGRRVVYSFASDQPPPFKARSARTWGGAWTVCDASSERCQTIDGEHPVAIDVEASQIRPGRGPARLQLAMASPPAAEPPPPEPAQPPPPAAESVPPPQAPAAPPRFAEAPPPAELAAPAAPPPALAEAEPAPSPYVEIPLPPRERQAVREDAPPAPPPIESLEVRIPAPASPQNAPVRRIAYACEDGRGLTVLFDDRDQTAMVLAGGRDPVALRRSQDRERGGFFYEGGGHVLFGAGARAGYATDGSEPVDCYARGARRQLSYRDARTYGPRFSGDGPDENEADEALEAPQGRW